MPGTEFTRNNVSSLTTLAFFFLANYSQYSQIGFELLELLSSNFTSQTRIKIIAAKKFINHMQELQLYLHDKILVAQAIYELQVNKHRRPCLYYFVKDKV